MILIKLYGMAKRKGRPPVPERKKLKVQVSVAMTAAENRKLIGIANKNGQSISELLMTPWREKPE